jgi:hypothetical protein
MIIAGEPLTIGPGTHDDLNALSAYHYLGGPPATIASIRRATWCGLLAGVVVTSYPTLNARWRSLAWGSDYDTGDKRADAQRLNREVRCISRVIVDPRCRAVGVAVALVRECLRCAPTRRTESLAAMGRMCPFFASAGMTPWDLPPTPALCRLQDAITRSGLRTGDLLDPNQQCRVQCDAFMMRELRIWANAQRHAHLNRIPENDLPPIAATALLCRPVAYTHDASTPMNTKHATMSSTHSRPTFMPTPHRHPRPLTLFLSQRECAAVRRALRTLDPDPASAVCRLLGIQRDPQRDT